MTEKVISAVCVSIFSAVVISAAVYVLGFLFVSKKVIANTPMYGKEDNKNPIYQIIALVTMSIMLLLFGLSSALVKGSVLLLVLLYASVCDIQTHEVKDFVPVLVGITALIGIDLSALPEMFIGAGFVFLLLLLCAVITDNRIGGADIKLSVACTFLLGLYGGLFGLVIGLLLAVLSILIFDNRNKDKAFPLIPYLSVGFITTFIFQNI